MRFASLPGQTWWVITIRPTLETRAQEDFDLWPAAPLRPFSDLRLHGGLTPAEIGAALAGLAEANWAELEAEAEAEAEADEADAAGDPVGAFLHGLLTTDALYVPGGLWITDMATGTVVKSGCCCGIEEWRDWYSLLDGTNGIWLGHDPEPLAELRGETVWLKADDERPQSPELEFPASVLRAGLAEVERDLRAFHASAVAFAAEHLPAHAPALTAVLARAFALEARP